MQRMGTAQSIIEIVSDPAYGVSRSDLDLWQQVVATLPPEYCDELVQFLSEDRAHVATATKNIRQKHEALNENNLTKWDAALAEEKTLSESYA